MPTKPDVANGIKLVFEWEYIPNTKIVATALSVHTTDAAPTDATCAALAAAGNSWIRSNTLLFNTNFIIRNVIARSLINGGPQETLSVNMPGTRGGTDPKPSPATRKVYVYTTGAAGRRNHNQMYWLGPAASDIDPVNPARYLESYLDAVQSGLHDLAQSVRAVAGCAVGIVSYANGMCQIAANDPHPVNDRINYQDRVGEVD